MLDLALMKKIPDIFTPLEMITGPPGLQTPAKLELVGQPLIDEPTSTSCRIKEEIR